MSYNIDTTVPKSPPPDYSGFPLEISQVWISVSLYLRSGSTPPAICLGPYGYSILLPRSSLLFSSQDSSQVHPSSFQQLSCSSHVYYIALGQCSLRLQFSLFVRREIHHLLNGFLKTASHMRIDKTQFVTFRRRCFDGFFYSWSLEVITLQFQISYLSGYIFESCSDSQRGNISY